MKRIILQSISFNLFRICTISFCLAHVIGFNAKEVRAAEANKTVYADAVYDLNKAAVLYELSAVNGDKLSLYVQYTDASAYSEVNDVHFWPASRQDGEYRYELSTKEGPKVIISFLLKNNEIVYARIDTEYVPQTSNNADCVLTVTSNGGCPIVFTFCFDNYKLANVNIAPRFNPFF